MNTEADSNEMNDPNRRSDRKKTINLRYKTILHADMDLDTLCYLQYQIFNHGDSLQIRTNSDMDIDGMVAELFQDTN